DVVDQFQRTKPRERVRWLHDDAQKRKRVFDMRRLRKPDPAKLAKRNTDTAELDFQIKRMRTRSKQHSDVTQRHAFFMQLSNALRDMARLFCVITRAHDTRRLTTMDTRVKPFFITLFHIADDRIGDVENR